MLVIGVLSVEAKLISIPQFISSNYHGVWATIRQTRRDIFSQFVFIDLFNSQFHGVSRNNNKSRDRP